MTGTVTKTSRPAIYGIHATELTNSRWLFRRSLVVDGNFAAEHLKMRSTDKDVRLANEEGYIVNDVDYQRHLSEGFEIREVCVPHDLINVNLPPIKKSQCANHQAISQSNARKDHLEATRIGACACSHHGCFVPHSVVDFQKGER